MIEDYNFEKSGIYQIRNIVNDKKYIGSTINFSNRKKSHFRNLKNNKHPNIHLQKSFNKYGESNFIFEILEYVEKDKLLEIEQKYLNEIFKNNKYYNLSKSSTAPMFGRNHSEESIRKMSGENNHLYGKKLSDEEIKRISNMNKGRIFSKDTLKKMSESAKIRVRPSREIIDIDTGNIYNSAKELANIKSINENVIREYCKEHKKIYNIYKFMYYDDYILNGDILRDLILPEKKVINLDTLEIFNSMGEAAIKYNINQSNITRCCDGRRLTSAGYHWLYYEDYLNNDIKTINKVKISKKIINLDTNEIFESTTKASKKYNVSSAAIANCCRNKTKSSAGYRWSYYDEYLENIQEAS